jgi:magnesium-protoporphyrin IX monomethyl ester (oxidative) cyclase
LSAHVLEAPVTHVATKQDPAYKAAQSSLLAPRLYKTDIDELNKLSIDRCREEFEALQRDFEADYNRAHFKWTDDAIGIDYRPLWREFYEFLHRSAFGEFSGCLLYSEVHKKLNDPTLSSIYMSMSRDEGRHSSFLNWVMRQMGCPFDMAALPKVEKLQYMHPKWIFVTTYLSEIVGFYRYQNISDHLKARPEFRFHPLFTYFDNWCKDERRHSRFFALMMRSQPQYYAGALNQLGIKFFTLAVYITMYLRDAESSIYEKMGIDWEKYDLKVINETELGGRSVWGLSIQTQSNFFVSCLRKMARNNRKNKAGRSAAGLAKLTAVPMRYLRWGNTVFQYAKLMAQPHGYTQPYPRERWLDVCPDPQHPELVAKEGAVPTSLPRLRGEAVPA